MTIEYRQPLVVDWQVYIKRHNSWHVASQTVEQQN